MVTEAEFLRVPDAVRDHMRTEQLLPAQVAELARSASVRTIALAHYAGADAAILAAIATEFDGMAIPAEDLLRLVLC